MSEFTAKGLVEYCKQALGWKTVYMWGGLMKTVTQAFIDYKKKQYPKYYSEARVKQLQTKIGNYYGCDCVGLIKSYLFGGINSPKYKSKWDTNTRGMYSVSKTKGTIETLPEIQGLILYMKGHVGVYIGNGECIECTLGKYGDGVVKTKVAGRGWTHWLQLPWLDYNDGVETECGCDCPCCQEKCKKKTDELNESFFPNVAYVNLSVLVPFDVPVRTEFMITVDPNVEFTIDSIIEKLEMFPPDYAILLSISYDKNGDSIRLESWNQKFILNKGAVLYIKLTIPDFFEGDTVGNNYFRFTSPFNCYPYFYISYTLSDNILLLQDDFFEYSRLLMWQGHISTEGNYYPMTKKYKSTYYAAITTACGAIYTLFDIEGDSVAPHFLRHEQLASESRWKNFHSDFVEIITLE